MLFLTLFRSRDFSDWPHRHWNYALRIDLDSTAIAIDRADATFSVVF